MIENRKKMLKNNNINLRNEFELLQNEFSHDILLIRASKYIRCSCYNSLHGVGNPDCHKCFGNGYVNSIEKIPAIEHPSYSSMGIQHTDIGSIDSNNNTFYFDYKVAINKGDLIVICKFKNGIPIEISEVYVVDNAIPVRGDFGRREFTSAVSKIRKDKEKSVKEAFSKLSFAERKVIASRKRFIWSTMKK